MKKSSLVLINLRGQTENNGGKLLLIEEEEWLKRENGDGKILFTKEEWRKRANKGGTYVSPSKTNRGGSDYRGKDSAVIKAV